MQHHIIVKWNDTVTDKLALIPAIDALFQNTTTIPGVHKVELFPNVIDRSNRYDLMIVMTMDEEALPVYDACSWHKQWKEEYGGRIEKKCIFDKA